MTLQFARLVVIASIGAFAACGNNELSRSDALTAIEARLRETVKPESSWLRLGVNFHVGHLSADGAEDEELKKYVKSGFVELKILGPDTLYGHSVTKYETLALERLRPYILQTRKIKHHRNEPGLQLELNMGGEPGKATVTGLAKSDEAHRTAEFTYMISYNEVGQVLFSKPPVKEQKGKALFNRYDDGWRITRFDTEE